MTDLIGMTNLEIGQESTEIVSGGGAKYSRTLKSGYYKAEINGYAAFGKVTKTNNFDAGKDKSVQDRIRLGFEIMECVLPVDPEAKDQPLIKEFGDDKEPYMIKVNNDLDFARSEGDNAQYPKIRDAVLSALPISVLAELEEKDLSAAEVYKSLKQVVGQQFIIYVHEEIATNKDGYNRNYIFFNKTKAEQFTKDNLAKGIKKKVEIGMEIHPIDGGNRVMGTKQLPVLEPTKALRTKMFVWDVTAEDMTQAHLDSVAHEYLYVGEECSPTDKSAPEYCQLLKMQLANGTLQGTAVGNKLEAGELKIPDPRAVKQEEEKDAVKVDFEDTAEIEDVKKEVAPAPFKTDEVVDGATEAEASEYDL